MTRPVIWWWQRIVSPHMVGLAAALAARGCDVTYVAEQRLSAHRARDGWRAPDLPGVRLELMGSDRELRALVHSAPADAVHICQGLRANGRVREAQRMLARRGARQWTVLETVDGAGWRGRLRRLEYRRLFRRRRAGLEAVLAIGHRTADWVYARGMPPERVFPFAYFLARPEVDWHALPARSARYRFIYVGQLIERKRVDLLLRSLAGLGREDVELLIVGDGPLRAALERDAARLLPGRVRWLGRCPMDDVPAHIDSADCLVLPSRHDGWGAVISEALMVGTPAICSAACGAAGVVRASGAGAVFDDANDLRRLLQAMLERGPLDLEDRRRLAAWAEALTAEAGAGYLLAILGHVPVHAVRPSVPWEKGAHSHGWAGA